MSGGSRGFWAATLHGHRRGWPHGRARPRRGDRGPGGASSRSIFVDDGRRARWGVLIGYGTGTALTLWLVLLVGSVVGAGWSGGADVPGAGDGSRRQAFDSPSAVGQREVTVAARRGPGADDRPALGDLQAVRATPVVEAETAPVGPQGRLPVDDREVAATAGRPAEVDRSAPTTAPSSADELAAVAPADRPTGATARRSDGAATDETGASGPDEADDEADEADELAGSFDEGAEGLDGPTRSAP